MSAVAIFEAGPLQAAAGGLDIQRIREYVETRLEALPRYRQRLSRTPIQRHPIWVDDAQFDISYHVRHTGLPLPGGDGELKELAGRIASVPLDRDRPLWELWIVEGLRGDRFAIVAKVHHSMVDGVSGVGVLQALFSGTTTQHFDRAPRWKPRPSPGTLDFLLDGAVNTARFSASALTGVGEAVLSPVATAESLYRTAESGLRTLQTGLSRRPPETPINGDIGAQRRIDWQRFDLREVRELRKRLEGSINDVVLTIVSGAMRRMLKARRCTLRGRDLQVIVPVNTRVGETDANVANRVSAWFVILPIAESNPLRRFQRIRAQTRESKQRDLARGIDRFLRFADWSGSTRLTSMGVGLVQGLLPYNLIVSNIHGPQSPLFLLGARLQEFYPVLPLFERQGLAIAAMSYRGGIGVGLTGDWDLLPDLPALPEALASSFGELRDAAEKRV